MAPSGVGKEGRAKIDLKVHGGSLSQHLYNINFNSTQAIRIQTPFKLMQWQGLSKSCDGVTTVYGNAYKTMFSIAIYNLVFNFMMVYTEVIISNPLKIWVL